ncbi:rhodanese-like domain-containing protein [Mollicutes bacterium LVI A0039]|nr:rhodanese-like domain-containing protein [Mollicutes bacterium LVI A0039]
MSKFKTININELSKISDPAVIDIRENNEVAMGMVPGAKHIPMMGLMLNPDNFLNKDTMYYIYCAGGGRSMQVCNQLSLAGYQVVNLDGGYNGYRR